MEKIIQFGEGGFLRGFADWMLQIVNEETDFDGQVVVVQPIPKGMCKQLEQQNNKYTHICKGKEGVFPKEISVISRCINPFDDYENYLKLADQPDFRFVISNTTESGIVFDEKDKEGTPYCSFPAKVTALLKRRYDNGGRGFVFLPCELIDKNGDNLKECVLKYASLWGYGQGFCNFVQNKNIFCNTLVDRINTGFNKEDSEKYNDNMINTSEYFHLWVIEGYKDLFSEIPFDKCGLNVILTDNLPKYRTRKVRILNGAHTSVTPYGLLSGFETVKSVVDDEKMYAFLKECIFDEIIPTLDLPKDQLVSYANDVLIRFSNPHIRHLLSSISLNSVSKYKVRVLPSVLEYIKRFGKTPKNLVFALAKLIEFYKKGTPTDDAGVIDFIKNNTVSEVLKNTALWGEDLTFLESEIEKYVD